MAGVLALAHLLVLSSLRPPPALAACEPPSTRADSFTVLEDAGASFQDVLANDPCASGFSGYDSSNAHGTLNYTVSGFSVVMAYQPTDDYAGPASYLYQAKTEAGTLSEATLVSITVVPINDAPGFSITVNTTGATVGEDSGQYTSPGNVSDYYPGGGADEAGQAVTIGGVPADPSLFSVQPFFDAQGHLHFTPAPNRNGSTVVTYRARDNGGTANGGVNTGAAYQDTITITAIADAPVGAPDAYSAKPGTLLSVVAPGVLANDRDADGQTITALVSALPAHGTLTLAPNGSFTYQPAAGFAGADAFTYVASDGSLTSGPTTVRITVAAVTPPPTLRPTSPSGLTPTASPASPDPTASTTPAGVAGPTASVSLDASLTPGDNATAGPDTSPSATLAPVGSGGTSVSDLTPIVLAVLIAGLLIAGAIVAAGYLRRRPGGDRPAG